MKENKHNYCTGDAAVRWWVATVAPGEAADSDYKPNPAVKPRYDRCAEEEPLLSTKGI